MPAQTPPEAVSIGSARSRLSASSLTSWLRCQKQWFTRYKLGLRSPLKPRQVLGILVEDALCGLVMERAGSTGNGFLKFHGVEAEEKICQIESLDDLRTWISQKIPASAALVLKLGAEEFDNSMWKKGDWGDILVEDVEEMLKNGCEFVLEEVSNCHAAGKGQHEFSIPAPCWQSPPHFPLPSKVNSRLKWDDIPYSLSEEMTWGDAWEVARPWVKDPRCFQPQRMYHDDRWAAGECDLVLRWDGNIRIVDIKIGSSDSPFSSSIDDQLNFYSWLWNETHEEKCTGLEGWFLSGNERKIVEITNVSTSDLKEIYNQMNSYPVSTALPISEPCVAEAGCYWCSLTEMEYTAVDIEHPYQSISSIPNRVNVRGVIQGAWGPLPNHFGEMVLGAMIQAGEKRVTLEESSPDGYPEMHNHPSGEIIIESALPGVWRRQPRLYLDKESKIVEKSDLEITRMGMLRTKANIEGRIISCGSRTGKRIDGRPWMMLAFHIWDGTDTVECVAFGSSINQITLSLQPGDHIKLLSADLGWRDGLVQLRVDSRTTRIEIVGKD